MTEENNNIEAKLESLHIENENPAQPDDPVKTDNTAQKKKNRKKKKNQGATTDGAKNCDEETPSCNGKQDENQAPLTEAPPCENQTNNCEGSTELGCSYCGKTNPIPTKRCLKRHPKCMKKLFCSETCEVMSHKKANDKKMAVAKAIACAKKANKVKYCGGYCC
eukprot:TRINITY_DN1777_c0_g1_i7.p1 TRINITY_DN1777_c0_g1~~TRINITY_DN1777_c0_g1_i7.p1  ORF type:complete len:164 (-),score=34.44 TRINITY_DN1777_c0_g1_i7:475-966(-)